MQEKLCCRTLHELDNGAAGAIIDAAIREAVMDLEDRAAEDGKPRQVEVKVTFSRADNGQIITHVEANAKVPRRRTASTIGKIGVGKPGESAMLFQTMAPDDPNQSTIDQHARHIDH